MTAMALDEQALRSALRKFRIGGAVIAAVPLLFGAMVLSMSDSKGASPFLITSVCLMLLVTWTVHCVEGMLKQAKPHPAGGVEDATAAPQREA